MGFHTSFGGSLGADVPVAGIGKAADLAPHITLSGEKKRSCLPTGQSISWCSFMLSYDWRTSSD